MQCKVALALIFLVLAEAVAHKDPDLVTGILLSKTCAAMEPKELHSEPSISQDKLCHER